MKRILITGSNGLLGQKLVELFSHCPGFSLTLASIEEGSVFASTSLPYVQLDLTHKTDVRKVIDEYETEIVINTAAITNVDLCESNRELAWRTNVDAVENLVHACKLTGAQIVHFSTDYVFDGHNGPYAEHDRPNPLSYYGRTKLASENLLAVSDVAHAIVRTMVLYGVGNGVKLNFALWLLKELSAERQVKVVDDQLGNPTLADDLAYAVMKIVELGRNGLYHIAGHDIVSRYEFAMEFAEVFGFSKKLIVPIKTATLSQPAPRPLKSGLITLKAQTDLGIKPSGVVQGLRIFRNQLDVHLKSAAGNASA